jgi:hypothetical protein
VQVEVQQTIKVQAMAKAQRRAMEMERREIKSCNKEKMHNYG